MADYYIAIDGQQQGPFPAQNLPSLGMRPESKVWCEGMGDWQQAEHVPELAQWLPGRQGPVSPAPNVAPNMPPMPGAGYPQGYGQVPFAQQAGSPYPQVGYMGAPPYNPANSNRVAAGVCGILLGTLGVHKFILGRTGAGLTMLFVSLLSCGFLAPLVGIVGIIEGIVYLAKSDADFHQVYVVEQRSWF